MNYSRRTSHYPYIGSRATVGLARYIADRASYIGAVLLFRLLIDVVYITFISPVYSYAGFPPVQLTATYLLSWLLVAALCVTGSSRFRQPSDVFLIIFQVFVIVPLLSFVGLTNGPLGPLWASVGAYLIVWLISQRFRFPVLRIPVVKNGEKIAITLAIVMVLYLVVWYVQSGAVRYMNFNLGEVYQTRATVAELTNISILGYINSWTTKVFNMFLLAIALYYRWWGLAIFSLITQIFFFSVSAHKSIAFYPLIPIAFLLILKVKRASIRSRATLLTVIPSLMCVLVLGGMIFYELWGSGAVLSPLVRRLLFLPAKLTVDYFAFFSLPAHEMVWWSQSFLSFALDSPYDEGIPRLIGMYNGSNDSANNGFIASGFAQAGYLGVFAYSVLVGLIFRFVDAYSKHVASSALACSITMMPIFAALVSSDLLTAMLTHGIAVSLLLLILIRGNSTATSVAHITGAS